MRGYLSKSIDLYLPHADWMEQFLSHFQSKLMLNLVDKKLRSFNSFCIIMSMIQITWIEFRKYFMN